MISETSCAIVCNVPHGLNSSFRHQSTYPPLTKHKNTLHPGSVRSRLARHPRFLRNVPEQDRLELLKDAKTKSCSSCYIKTFSPESLMVVLSKRKLTKQNPKKDMKKITKHYSCVSFISFSGQNQLGTNSCLRTCIKCNFVAFDFGYHTCGRLNFRSPARWYECLVCPCCLSVCFSLAPAPSLLPAGALIHFCQLRRPLAAGLSKITQYMPSSSLQSSTRSIFDDELTKNKMRSVLQSTFVCLLFGSLTLSTESICFLFPLTRNPIVSVEYCQVAKSHFIRSAAEATRPCDTKILRYRFAWKIDHTVIKTRVLFLLLATKRVRRNE